MAQKHARVWDEIRRASDDMIERERLASIAAADFLAVGMSHLATRLCLPLMLCHAYRASDL